MSKRAFYLVIVTLSFLTGIYAQPEVDISFNATGKVTTDFGSGLDVYPRFLFRRQEIVAAEQPAGAQPSLH